MAYYLQIDGVDDVVYYATPGNLTNLSVDEIIIDCEVTGRAAFDKYISSSHMGFYQRNGSNQDQWSGNWSAVYVNGVSKTNLTDSVPLNQRITIRAVGTSTLNSAVYFFANNPAGAGSTAGKIYSVTVKNAGGIVAFYDMTLGNVQDQSGNGRHATLVGGIWVSDVSNLTGSGTSSGTSTTSASNLTLRKQAAGTTSGTSLASALPILRRTASGVSSGKAITSVSLGGTTLQASGTSSGTATTSAAPILRRQMSGVSSGKSTLVAIPIFRRTSSVVSSGISWTSLNVGTGGSNDYYYYRRKKVSVFGLLR